MTSKFQLAFTTVAFNNSYDDVYRFDSRAEQETFFEVARLFQQAPYVNIILNDFVTMTVTYKLDGTDLFDYEKYNYCILRETVSENNYKYYYYFIKSMIYDSGNQFIIKLECDVMQTYYLGCVFAPCLINRAHLDRWKTAVGNTVTLNNAPDSKMLIPEVSIPYSKFCTGRYRLGLPQRFAEDKIIKWLNDNVEAWVYIYIHRSGESNNEWVNRTYTVQSPRGDSTSQTTFNYCSYDDGSGHFRAQELYYSVLCYPLYRRGVTPRLQCRFDDTIAGYSSFCQIDYVGEEGFNQLNKDTSFYISKQISHIPPFTLYGTENTDWTIGSNNNLIIKHKTGGHSNQYYETTLDAYYINTVLESSTASTYAMHGLFYVDKLETQIGLMCDSTEFAGIPNTFNITDIVGADYNIAYNPKVRSPTFMELTISNEAGAQFSYDIQKMDNTEDIKFMYSEYPSPSGTTRGYLRLASGPFDYGVYTEYAQQNLTGLVFNQDLNLNFANNQLASFLANNRNMFTQVGARIGQSVFNTVWGTAKDLALTFVGKGKVSAGTQARAGTQAGGDLIQAGVNTLLDVWQTNMSIDNMRGAPDVISNANGQVMFNSTYSEIGLYVEIYQCLPIELYREGQRMHLYGFEYKMIDQLKSYDNVRHYFNYISANINSVVYNDGVSYSGLPLPIYNILKAIFNKGVRFWNVASTGVFLEYTKDNYENNLVPASAGDNAGSGAGGGDEGENNGGEGY